MHGTLTLAQRRPEQPDVVVLDEDGVRDEDVGVGVMEGDEEEREVELEVVVDEDEVVDELVLDTKDELLVDEVGWVIPVEDGFVGDPDSDVPLIEDVDGELNGPVLVLLLLLDRDVKVADVETPIVEVCELETPLVNADADDVEGAVDPALPPPPRPPRLRQRRSVHPLTVLDTVDKLEDPVLLEDPVIMVG
ncbi:MAG: hypothetical protein Q9166_003345 [cf. Caloplaca sp. 2 TL-2023]